MKIAFSLLSCLFIVAAAQADEVRLHILGPDKKPVVGAKVSTIEASGFRDDRKVAAALSLTSNENGDVAFDSKNALAQVTATEPLRLRNGIVARVSSPGMATVVVPIKAGDNEINLEVAQTWSGVALDENKAPIVGAKIIITAFDSSGQIKIGLPQELQLTSTTDANGKWNFEGMPRSGKAQLEVEDPRYVRESLTLSLASATAPPLFLERGATIKGRLLTPEGEGAANVPLYPGGRSSFFMDDRFRTGPDGRFTFSSLSPGDFYLQYIDFGRSQNLPFIIEPKQVKAVKAGEVRDIGDWKTEKGILVRGKVVDDATKAPLQAYVRLWGPGNFQGRSDKTGAFSFRASDEASMSSVSAAGYSNFQKQVPDAKNGILDLGTIELKKGIEVRGTTKDKQGNGMRVSPLYADKQNGERQYGSSTPNGEFVFQGLEPGTYILKAEGVKFVAPVQFVVTVGHKTAPIEAIVDVQTADTPKLVQGRALDKDGRPVAGARISLHISNPSRSYMDAIVISGVDGLFETEFFIDNGTPKVSEVKLPGFLLVSSSDFKVVDGVWRSDLVFQPRGGALKGHILDSQGKPIGKAFISVASRNDVPIVASDETGAFALPDVPLEGVTLVASNGRSYATTIIEKEGADARVTLPAGHDYDAMALADEILPNSRLGNLWDERWTSVWEALGTQRMEEATLRANTGKGDWNWTWNEYLRQLARRDPQSFLARGDELLGQTDKASPEALALLASLRARSANPEDRKKAADWLQTQSKPSLALNADSVATLLRTGIVAEALQKGGGDKWVDFAAQIAAQLTDKARAENANEWGVSAIRISPQAFDNLIQDWGGNAQLNAYRGVVQEYSQAGNIKAARAAFKRMEELVPAAQTAKDEVRIEGFVQKPKDVVAQARSIFARALSKTDPGAALELATDVPDYDSPSLLIEIGNNAGKLGQKEIAAKALRQVFEVKYSNVEPGAAAAETALDIDPELADELFKLSWEKSKPRGDDDDFGYSPSVAAYASARATRWPGESRILIERDWAERIKSYKPPKDNDYDGRAEALKALVAAMARIDARRALEMAEQLPEKDNMRAQARGQIAIALLQKSKGQAAGARPLAKTQLTI